MKLLLILSLILILQPDLTKASKISLPPLTLVEGVAHLRGTLFLASNVINGNVLLIDARTSIVVTIAQAPRGRVGLGLVTDSKQHVFVAGAGEQFSQVLASIIPDTVNDYSLVKPSIHVYHVSNGSSVASCVIEDAVLVNDVTYDEHYVYATDSGKPFVYRLDRRELPSCQIDQIPLPAAFSGEGFRANGIRKYKDGLLVVNSHLDSLWYIDLSSGTYPATQVLSPGMLSGADGIDLFWEKGLGTVMYSANNFKNQIALFTLSYHRKKGRVVAKRFKVVRRPNITGATSTVAVGPYHVLVPNFNATEFFTEGPAAQISLVDVSKKTILP